MGKYVNLYNYFEGDIEAKVWFNSKEVPYYRSLIRTGFCIWQVGAVYQAKLHLEMVCNIL